MPVLELRTRHLRSRPQPRGSATIRPRSHATARLQKRLALVPRNAARKTRLAGRFVRLSRVAHALRATKASAVRPLTAGNGSLPSAAETRGLAARRLTAVNGWLASALAMRALGVRRDRQMCGMREALAPTANAASGAPFAHATPIGPTAA